jgi:hypothetical protein
MLLFVFQNFRWIRQEQPASYTPSRCFEDDRDTDPYVRGKQKMGRSYSKHPGNLSTPYPDKDIGSDDEIVCLEVYYSAPFSL